MSPEAVAALISAVGVVLSGLLAAVVGRHEAKGRIAELLKQHELEREAALLVKRREIYPKIVEIISIFSKERERGLLDRHALDRFSAEVDSWDSANTAFLSPTMVHIMIRLRHEIRLWHDLPEGQLAAAAVKSRILQELLRAEQAVKHEIGVYGRPPRDVVFGRVG